MAQLPQSLLTAGHYLKMNKYCVRSYLPRFLLTSWAIRFQLLTLGAHAQRGFLYCCVLCLSVCLSITQHLTSRAINRSTQNTSIQHLV